MRRLRRGCQDVQARDRSLILPMGQGPDRKEFDPGQPSKPQTSNPASSYDHNEHIMDQTQDFKSLQDQIQAALLATTRASSQISSEDLGFQRSLNPQVGSSLDEQTARLLELAGTLVKSAASISELQIPVLDDVDDVDSNWHSIVDVVDSLLEKTDICLDEYSGVIKRKETPVADQASS
jgi:hypothetical protein